MQTFGSRLKAGVMEIKPKKTTSIAIQGSIKPYRKSSYGDLGERNILFGERR